MVDIIIILWATGCVICGLSMQLELANPERAGAGLCDAHAHVFLQRCHRRRLQACFSQCADVLIHICTYRMISFTCTVVGTSHTSIVPTSDLHHP
jgi:hypothetical protein